MKVRTSLSLVCVVSFLLVLFPCYVLGQDAGPPHCCNAPIVTPGSTVAQSRVVMTDSTLASMGVSRAQFIDRLIAVLMPDKQVSLVYSTTLSLNPAAVAEVSAGGQSPEAVTVTQQYRVPRDMMRPEDIEALDQLTVTDGVVSIVVNFRRSTSSVPLP